MIGTTKDSLDLRKSKNLPLIQKVRIELGWEPRIRFNNLVKIMVDADMRRGGKANKAR